MNWLQRISGKYYQDMTDEEKAAVIDDFVQRYGLQRTSDGKIILYHGTRLADQVRAAGKFNRGTYFTTDPSYAAHEGDKNRRGGQMQVLRVKVDPRLVCPGVHWTALADIPVEEV